MVEVCEDLVSVNVVQHMSADNVLEDLTQHGRKRDWSVVLRLVPVSLLEYWGDVGVRPVPG